MAFTKNLALASIAFLIAANTLAGTWQAVPVTGVAGTWQSLCAAAGASNTWQPVQGCQSSGITLTIASNTTNYNLYNAAVANGWNTTTPLVATVIINSGVVVYASSTANYAFTTGGLFPSGSAISVINNGIIAGAGGAGGAGASYNTAAVAGSAGGPALFANSAIQLTNNGIIAGGGGGGSGAAVALYGPPYAPRVYGGGGGGGGQGYNNAPGGAGGQPTNGGGAGYAGGSGSGAAAGAGGGSPYAGTPKPIGGAGGNWGAAGVVGTGSPVGPAGAGGAAIVGNAYISWKTTGTIYGAVQ